MGCPHSRLHCTMPGTHWKPDKDCVLSQPECRCASNLHACKRPSPYLRKIKLLLSTTSALLGQESRKALLYAWLFVCLEMLTLELGPHLFASTCWCLGDKVAWHVCPGHACVALQHPCPPSICVPLPALMPEHLHVGGGDGQAVFHDLGMPALRICMDVHHSSCFLVLTAVLRARNIHCDTACNALKANGWHRRAEVSMAGRGGGREIC